MASSYTIKGQNDLFAQTEKVTATDLIIYYVNKYYRTNPGVIDKVIAIILGNSKITISLIEWVVVVYADIRNIAVNAEGTGSTPFFIHRAYKAQLKSFKKSNFDPFCRGKKICFNYGKEKYIITTTGQLNFFRWLCENNILTYIENNCDFLIAEMRKETHVKKETSS